MIDTLLDWLTYALIFAAIIIIFIILYRIFKFLVTLLLIGVFAALAFLTNPSEEKHKEAVREKASQKSISLKNKKIDREDFYVFSLTRVTGDEGRKIVGAGAFTQVYIFRNP